MEQILPAIDEDCESAGSYSVGSDTNSVITLQEHEMYPATPTLHSQVFTARAENVSAAVTEKVLAATEDVLAIAKKLYSVLDDRYVDEELLDVPYIGAAGEKHQTRDHFGQTNNKAAFARKQLNDMKARLRIAKAQSVLAENRLRVARAHEQLIEDRVLWAAEQLDFALEK